MLALRRQCDERSDEAIRLATLTLDCFAELASGARSRDPFRNDGTDGLAADTLAIARFGSPSRKVHALHAGSLREHAQPDGL